MKSIVANIVRGRTLSYLLAAGLTFAAAQTAQAADRNWKGGGSDTLWSTAGNWKDNALPSNGDNIRIYASEVNNGNGFSGKTVTIRDTYTNGVLHVSGGSNAEGPIVFNADQNSSHGVTFTDDGWLGYYAEGALWLKSGTYTFNKSLRVGVNTNNDGSYKEDKNSFWLKVGDGSSTVVLNAKGTVSGPIIGKSSKLIADKATLDFTGKIFNMYSSASVDIKDSEMTATTLNVAVNNGSNCKAVFNGGSLTLSSYSTIGYGKNTTGRLIATNLTFETSEGLRLGGFDNNNNYTGAKGYVEKTDGDWILHKLLNIAMAAGSTGVFTNYSGTVDVRDDVYVGRSGGTGTLAIEGGTVTVISTKAVNLGWSSGHGWLYLDGGVLVCKNVHYFNDGHVVFNGGTLKANAVGANGLLESSLDVTLGERGGTIDSGNLAISIPAAINGADGDGGMTFKGGNTITLSGTNNYTGKTKVEVGTTLVVPAAISGDKLAFAFPEAGLQAGEYEVVRISGDGTFAADVLDNVADKPENVVFHLTNNNKSISATVVAEWVGGVDSNLSNPANWSNKAVPTGGSVTIKCNSPATLTVGDTFAPSTITFHADTALVTISGEGTLSGLTSIVNNSSQHHVIACPVDASAATPTLPLASGNYLVFSGGIALNAMPSVNNMRLAGVWNLTGDWNEPPTGTYIVVGSTVTVSGTLTSGYNIVVQEKATLQVATAKANLGADSKNRFLYQNDGTFIVTGEMQDKILSSGDTTYSLAGFFEYGNNNAVTRANGLVHAGSTKNNHQFRLNSKSNSVTNTIVLGLGGLSFRNNRETNSTCYPYFQIDSGKAVKLASSADWSIPLNTIQSNGVTLELVGNVVIDTSDYDAPTVGHTVHALGKLGNSGAVAVTGCGTMSFEYASDFAGGLSVKDTATVSFNAGCGPTRSGANMASGTTLKVAESGTVALGGNLTLADGATLAFNFTSKENAPTLDYNGKTVTASGTVKVKVSAAGGIRPKGGTYTLSSGGGFNAEGVTVSLDETDKPKWAKKVESNSNGNIVLTVKPAGLMILVM